MKLHIIHDGSTVYVHAITVGRDDFIVRQVTGNVTTVDGAIRAAACCFLRGLGHPDHDGALASHMADGFNCLAAAAFFAAKGGKVEDRQRFEAAYELAERGAAFEEWMAYPIFDVIVTLGLRLSRHNLPKPVHRDDFRLLGMVLVQTAIALDHRQLVVGVSTRRIEVLLPVGEA